LANERRSTPSSPPSRDNIETILQLEREDEKALAPHHRMFQTVGWFVGTIYFIVVQCAGVGLWIALNSMSASNTSAVDHFPFPLLATFLSFEAVLLTSFVLIRQNAINRTAERRDHLELQINLLAERESTRSLELLQRIAEHLNLASEADRQRDELAEETSVHEIAHDLRAQEKDDEK
jgi:uncharacterized membrane protein